MGKPLVFGEQKMRKLMTDDDREGVNAAFGDATEQTLWDRITLQRRSIKMQLFQAELNGSLDDLRQYAEGGVIPKECEVDVEKIKKILNE